MKCSKFPERDAAGMCAYSGKPYCSEELVEVQGKMYGKDNLSHVMAEMKERLTSSNPNPMVFMNAGGGGGGAAAVAPPLTPAPLVGTKSKGAAIAWAWLLGGLGAHKFYLGQPVWGILYLLFCWTGIPSILGFIEGLNYLFMSEATFYRRYG